MNQGLEGGTVVTRVTVLSLMKMDTSKEYKSLKCRRMTKFTLHTNSDSGQDRQWHNQSEGHTSLPDRGTHLVDDS